MDYGSNLDLTNVYIQDFEVMVDPMAILQEYLLLIILIQTLIYLQ